MLTPLLDFLRRNTLESLAIYWLLLRIIVPVTVVAEILSRLGVFEAVAPVLSPVMDLVGLPPELGLAWLTAMVVGLWGAIPLLFTLVPVSALSVADVTVFSALILFAHALPIEQKIIQKAGPGMLVTTALRVLGGLVFAIALHQVLSATGWLSAPVDPAWVPMDAAPDWEAFALGLAEAMFWMLVVLIVLSWGLELLKVTGLLRLMMWLLAPLLRLAGIRGEAEHLTAIGLFLGIAYGGGLLIKEARSNTVSPRQIFLACVFMGFTHSIIEDSLLMIALGADAISIVAGRLAFAVAATAAIAVLLRVMTDSTFFAHMFRMKELRAE